MMFVKNHDGSTEIYFQSEDEEKRMLDILRPHGKWIPVGKNLDAYSCSVCSWLEEYKSCFCANCGSDMRQKEGETNEETNRI